MVILSGDIIFVSLLNGGLLSSGSKFFPLQVVNHYDKGFQCPGENRKSGKQTGSHGSCSPCNKNGKETWKCTRSPLFPAAYLSNELIRKPT